MVEEEVKTCNCDFLSTDVCTALQEVYDAVCLQGTACTYIERGEQDVERDSLGAMKKRSLSARHPMKAFPVERQPNRKQLERAGIREDVDTVVYLPLLSLIEEGLLREPSNEEYTTLGEDFAALEIVRSTVLLDGQEWKIRDKGFASRLQGIPLYVTLGLARN